MEIELKVFVYFKWDSRFTAQYDRMLKKMHDRMELLSSSLLNRIRSSFANPQSNNLYSEDASGDNKSLPKSKLAQSINSYSEDASAFPRQSGAQTVPEPPQPHDKIREREEPWASCVRGWYGSAAVGLSLSAIIF